MKTIKKCVRPLSMQSDNESRRLWQNVTNALKSNDINLATQHKRFVSDFSFRFNAEVFMVYYKKLK